MFFSRSADALSVPPLGQVPGVGIFQNFKKNASKKTSKNGILKKLLFFGFLAIFGIFDIVFHRFWVPKGVPGGSFFDVFFAPRFETFFWCFFLENLKNVKNRKHRFVS